MTGQATRWEYGDPAMRGRERELQIAAEFLDAAERGRGGVLLIEGEPGIGKSEILGEVINQAVKRNFSLASAMPFAPLLAALREPLGGPTGQAPRSGTPEAWIPVVDRIRTLLEQRARASPLLVSLDDLHFADPATLFALRMLPRQLASYPLVWCLARCTVWPRRGTGELFDLLAGEGATRVTPAPLADEAVAGLIADVLGAVPDPGLTALASGAAGNPFLVVELIRGLREENAIRVRQGTATLVSAQLPQRVRTVARRRLEGLSGGAQYLLQTAAVLGLTFELEDVAEMRGQTPAIMFPLVDEAVGAGILKVSAEEDFAFGSELIWWAVTEAVPPPARQALHRQFGEMLLARGGSAMTADLDSAAEEVLRSSPQTAADLALRALELTEAADPARFSRTMRAAGALTAAARLEEATSVVRAALAQPQPPAYDTQLHCALTSTRCLQGQALEALAEAETLLGRPHLTGPWRDEVVVAQLQSLN